MCFCIYSCYNCLYWQFSVDLYGLCYSIVYVGNSKYVSGATSSDCKELTVLSLQDVFRKWAEYLCNDSNEIKGKFDWGVWYVIIFLYAQFWIRLAAVSKRGKDVRTVAFPAVRSVNKSRDTRNCVQNKPEYAICVIFTTRSYYKALGFILCYLI